MGKGSSIFPVSFPASSVLQSRGYRTKVDTTKLAMTKLFCLRLATLLTSMLFTWPFNWKPLLDCFPSSPSCFPGDPEISAFGSRNFLQGGGIGSLLDYRRLGLNTLDLAITRNTIRSKALLHIGKEKIELPKQKI